jgi:pyruvate/2-oxoglutarate/acetoin dehydrogenase E1 component
MIQISVVLSTSNCTERLQDVPKDYYTLPLGKAALLKEGIRLLLLLWSSSSLGFRNFIKILKFQQIYWI